MHIGPAILAAVLAVPAFAQQAQETKMDLAGVDTRVAVPTGTHILLALRSTVSTRNARPGDGVYLESAFPVSIDGRIVIPEGTAFQGVVERADRSGRLKGRATLRMRIQSMIYTSGYMVQFESALQSTPGSDRQKVVDKEGTIREESTRGKDALLATGAAVAGGYAGSATGALVGALANGSPRIGGAIGGGTAAAAGLIAVLAMRGPEIRLEPGAMVEIVLENPITIDLAKIGDAPQLRPEPVRSKSTRERPPREHPHRPGLPLPFPRL